MFNGTINNYPSPYKLLFFSKETNKYSELFLGEPQSESDHQAHRAYEEWLMQNTQWLALNIKTLEQQVGKFRKNKKALTAKQRQVQRQIEFNSLFTILHLVIFYCDGYCVVYFSFAFSLYTHTDLCKHLWAPNFVGPY